MENLLTSHFILIVAITTIALTGASFLVIGLRRLIRGKFLSGSGLSVSGGGLLALTMLAVALLANLYTYQRLTYEQSVGELAFKRTADHHYRVRLMEPNGALQILQLQGDEWQLDARVVKWHGAANLLGLDPLYRLERLSGRYRDVQQEQNRPRSVYGLAKDTGLDLWNITQRYGRWLPWLDITYGSATYMPMADDAHYKVRLTTTGLIARPDNPAAELAVANWR
ncbi:MAG TPA: hypothetical protein VK138_15215 [Acidiferrobacterales bacterium]|nr:hypothetical protein [Acidiferrobacterales bacterium]